MRIHIVTPIITRGLWKPEDFTYVVHPGTELAHTEIDKGPASIESEYDEALAVPDTLAKIVEAEASGADAVVINCMGDPGVKPGREMVSIPVIGPSEATMHLASILGHKFSIVTVLERVAPLFENQAQIYGVADKLASVRWVDIPVLDLEKDRDRLVKALVVESIKAIEEDGAHVIIFGCTGMAGFAEAVEEGLKEKGYEGIPVIDPIIAAIKLTEALVDLGLSHSKKTYPLPPAKKVVGYRIERRTVG
jgi:allantoin racemase